MRRVCAFATAIMLVPVWLYRWFPTQDGPSHLYNSLVLAHYNDAANSVMRTFFTPRLALFPNWTTYALMAALARIFPPLVVQQLTLTLCVIAIPAATIYLQKSFKDELDISSLLAPLLAFSYVLFMGFYNFVIASAFFALAVGFWWRHRRPVHYVILYLLLAATYLSHGLAFAAALMTILVLAAVERRWWTPVALAPALALLVYDALPRMHAAKDYRSFMWHLEKLGALEPFYIFNDVQKWTAAAIGLFIAIAIIATLIARRANVAAFATLALLIGFFIAPWGYGAGQPSQGQWISDRLLFLAVMTLPAWLEFPRPLIAYWLLSIVVALHVVTCWMNIAKLDARIALVAQASPFIRPHTTLDVLGTRPNITARIAPALHAPAYLAALQSDVVYLPDYEARLAEFPIAFRRDAPRVAPDYVFVWHSARIRSIAGYHVIAAGHDYRLMAR